MGYVPNTATIVDLLEEEWRIIDKTGVEALLLDSMVPNIITIKPTEWALNSTINLVLDPVGENTSEQGGWSLASIPLEQEFNLGFEPKTSLAWVWQRTGDLPVHDLEMSRKNGIPLDTTTMRRVSAFGVKNLEAFVLKGQQPRGGYAVAASVADGLVGAATAVAASAGSYKTALNLYKDVKTMWQKMIDNSIKGPYDLIADARTWPYLKNLIGTTTRDKEEDLIKDLIGGNIYLSDQMPVPTAADDTCYILVANREEYYRLKYIPLGFEFGAKNVKKKAIPFRAEFLVILEVPEPLAISKMVDGNIT